MFSSPNTNQNNFGMARSFQEPVLFSGFGAPRPYQTPNANLFALQTSTSLQPVSAPVNTAHERARTAALEILKTGEYSDLTITCKSQDRTWNVHRAIVCARCPFFATCLKHAFKETQDNTIDLPEDKPLHIDYFLKYLYTYDLQYCQDSCFQSANPTYEDQFALFSMADKYMQPEMESHWQKKLITEANNMKDIYPRLKISPFSAPDYNILVQDKDINASINMVIEFAEKLYDCNNDQVTSIKTAFLDILPIFNHFCQGRKSLLVHMLSAVIEQHPDLGHGLIKRLGKDNRPLQELLDWEAMINMLSGNQNVMISLLNSLATPTR